MLDDLGWGDLSATTGQFPTPNMDALYEQGVRLQHHYVHLMCSPSRTQFLTGRYAMHQGFGQFYPWNNQEIGGIPIGQPTLANWLSEFGAYSTYAVGKWHLGYANTQLTPKAKGFQHFFGFYQGAIDYVTKIYNDIEYGPLAVYDFFEDEEACYDIIESEQNTMYLYADKIDDYLRAEARKVRKAERNGEMASPFFMFAALQSMHAPLPTVAEFAMECVQRVSGSSVLEAQEKMLERTALNDLLDKDYQDLRTLYCELTLLTDEVIGRIVGSLREHGLYENTLIVFTADNGGETDLGGSNYPFRGTKGESFEGNTRVIASVAGGVVERLGVADSERDALFSNLDWTPTLLRFAGYLQCIDRADYSWDGLDQFDALFGGADADADTERERSHLILNVGNNEMTSANLVLRHGGRLYKYSKYDAVSPADRWVFTGRLSDVWSLPDADDANALRRVEFDADDDSMRFSQLIDDAFLFDLTNDTAERFNLLHSKLPHFDAALNAEVIARAEAVLGDYMRKNEDELFSSPFEYLHERLPGRTSDDDDDGRFVRPFLDDKTYAFLIEGMLDTEARKRRIPRKLAKLYTEKWTPPPRSRTADDEQRVAAAAAAAQPKWRWTSKRTPLSLSVLAVCAAIASLTLCGVAAYRNGPKAANAHTRYLSLV